MATQYVHDDTGTYIPATQRPDGTWRKARRVKDGYVPQEEMPLYESKGKQWAKNRPTMPIGLDPCYVVDNTSKSTEPAARTIPGLDETQVNATKSSKKKKKKKKEASKVADDLEKLDISAENCSKTSPKPTPISSNQSDVKTQSATDATKRLRNLRKKLKEINALKQKIESGELANPEKEQLEKVARKEEVEAEIEALELEL